MPNRASVDKTGPRRSYLRLSRFFFVNIMDIMEGHAVAEEGGICCLQEVLNRAPESRAKNRVQDWRASEGPGEASAMATTGHTGMGAGASSSSSTAHFDGGQRR